MVYYSIFLLLLIDLQFYLSITQSLIVENPQKSGAIKNAISYTLDFSSVGRQPTNQCAFRNQQGQCIACYIGYRLNGQQCIKIQQRCKIYNPQNYQCLQCYDYFQLKNKICYDIRCQIRGFYTCQKCLPAFSMTQKGFCVDINCVTYKNGYCQTCRSPYLLQNITKNCIQKPVIKNNSVSNSVATVIQIKVSPNSTTGCRFYNQKAQCITCENNYQLINKHCQHLNKNCTLYNSSLNQCLKCQTGFELVNKGCINYKILNCLKQSNMQCTQCDANYFLAKGACIKIDENCRTYDNFGKCMICIQGYSLVTQRCFKSDNNPSLIANKSTSNLLANSSISQSTKLPLNYYCVKKQQGTDKCLQCFEYFYPQKGICTGVSQLCRKYNKIDGKCLLCFIGYVLIDGSCMVDQTRKPQQSCSKLSENKLGCQVCNPRFFRYQQSLCLQVTPSCRQYSTTNGSCLSCYKGFHVNNNLCEVIPTGVVVPYCKQYNPIDLRVCVNCIIGYGLYGNRCIFEEQTCVKTGNNNSVCIQCISGYILQQNSCIKKQLSQSLSPNCQQYSPNGFCTNCFNGYQLINYICY